MNSSGAETKEPGVLSGVALVVAVGIVLGVGYNFTGLRSDPAFGLDWIAKPVEVPDLEDLIEGGTAAAGGDGVESTPVADTTGIPAGLGHPIQVQLPAVKRLFDARSALIVDARTREEFTEGHIAGARNLPYEEALPEDLEGLDAGGQPIVVYCGGGTCELSMSLGWDLVHAGHDRVLVFMGGYPEWEGAGYPTRTGSGAEATVAGGGSLATDIDDPMAFFGEPASESTLPAIPDLDRPIKMQLETVKRFVDARAALVVDARAAEEFVDGHIPGAINIPYGTLKEDPGLLVTLNPGNRPIIAYCGGGTCEESMNLAFALVEAGFERVLVFEGGMPEWVAAGYPVERPGGEAS